MQKFRELRGEFVRYASLSALGTLGTSCYILADTFFVAKGLGLSLIHICRIPRPAAGARARIWRGIAAINARKEKKWNPDEFLSKDRPDSFDFSCKMEGERLYCL